MVQVMFQDNSLELRADVSGHLLCAAHWGKLVNFFFLFLLRTNLLQEPSGR